MENKIEACFNVNLSKRKLITGVVHISMKQKVHQDYHINLEVMCLNC